MWSYRGKKLDWYDLLIEQRNTVLSIQFNFVFKLTSKYLNNRFKGTAVIRSEVFKMNGVTAMDENDGGVKSPIKRFGSTRKLMLFNSKYR